MIWMCLLSLKERAAIQKEKEKEKVVDLHHYTLLLEKEKETEKRKVKEMEKELKASQKVVGVTIARAILMTLSTAIVAVEKDRENE